MISSFQNGVLTITLNRPDVFNSFDQDMGNSFQSVLDEAAGDPSVRCVVITGEGRAFCAGQDLKEGSPLRILLASKSLLKKPTTEAFDAYATWKSPWWPP